MAKNTNSVHLRREIKFTNGDGSKMSYGTMNRIACKSVYLAYNPSFIVKTAFNSLPIENVIRKESRRVINDTLARRCKNITGTIVDMHFSKEQMEPNIKSKVLFELFIGTGDRFSSIEEYDEVMKEIGSGVSGIITKHIGEMVDFI